MISRKNLPDDQSSPLLLRAGPMNWYLEGKDRYGWTPSATWMYNCAESVGLFAKAPCRQSAGTATIWVDTSSTVQYGMAWQDMYMDMDMDTYIPSNVYMLYMKTARHG